jgi:hypothetical protein
MTLTKYTATNDSGDFAVETDQGIHAALDLAIEQSRKGAWEPGDTQRVTVREYNADGNEINMLSCVAPMVVSGSKNDDWDNEIEADAKAVKPDKLVPAELITVIDDGQVRYAVLTGEMKQWVADNGEISVSNYDRFCDEVSYLFRPIAVGSEEMIAKCAELIDNGADIVRLEA